jgi:hypothetical protein
LAKITSDGSSLRICTAPTQPNLAVYLDCQSPLLVNIRQFSYDATVLSSNPSKIRAALD